MSKAEEKALEAYPVLFSERNGYDNTFKDRIESYIKGYRQAEKDIKEELSNLFQEFMMDCINDDTDTHILHFIDVFNNKIKTIGHE